MNRILDTLIGPQSPLLGATRAHSAEQLTVSNWHCKARPAFANNDHHYLYIVEQVCQRSRQRFYSVALQHQRGICVLVTFFELTDALQWIEHCPWVTITAKPTVTMSAGLAPHNTGVIAA